MPTNKKQPKLPEGFVKVTESDKAKLKEEIIKDVKSDVEANIRTDLSKKISEDLFSAYTISEKDRIKQELTDEIKEDVKRRIVKEEALLSRKKSLKIFRLSIYIIILLAAVGYGVYRLYKTDNFDILDNNYTKPSTEAVGSEVTTTTTKTVDELKEKYSYLVNKLYIDDVNILLGNKSVAELNPSERLTIAYYSLSNGDVTREGRVTTIAGNKLQEAYKEIFGNNALYSNADFTASGIKFAYLTSQDSYFGISDIAIERNIQSEILEITEDKGNVKITMVIGLTKDHNLYSLNDLNNPIVTNYASSVMDYKDSLTKVEYTFNNVEGAFRLNRIQAK